MDSTDDNKEVAPKAGAEIKLAKQEKKPKAPAGVKSTGVKTTGIK